MELEFINPEQAPEFPRVYVAIAHLANFRGHQNVELHIIRTGATVAELEEVRALGLVEKTDLPAALLAGATVDSSLACLLEMFTREEAEQLGAYLRDRYGDQIIKLTFSPIQLPLPLGLGPLGAIPESEKSGFINFDQASGYPLPFGLRGYYDLGTSED